MISLKLDPTGWTKASLKLAALPAKIERVKAQAAIEGGDKVRTDLRRALKDVTGAKRYADITSRVFSRSPAAGQYVIVARGPGLPISAFKVRSAGGAVEAEPWGIARIFKRSFFDPSGLARARLTIHRKPVRRLFGPNLAKELVKANMEERFYTSVQRNVLPVIEKRMARVFT